MHSEVFILLLLSISLNKNKQYYVGRQYIRRVLCKKNTSRKYSRHESPEPADLPGGHVEEREEKLSIVYVYVFACLSHIRDVYLNKSVKNV